MGHFQATQTIRPFVTRYDSRLRGPPGCDLSRRDRCTATKDTAQPIVNIHPCIIPTIFQRVCVVSWLVFFLPSFNGRLQQIVPLRDLLFLYTHKNMTTAAKKPAVKKAMLPKKAPTLKPHSKNKLKHKPVVEIKKAAPTTTTERRPVRFSRNTTARRAIIRAQKTSAQSSIIKFRPFLRLVNDAMPYSHVSRGYFRLQQGFVEGLRDVTEGWTNDVTKSARRLAQEQVPPAQTVMGRMIQSAVYRWSMADPKMNSIYYAYLEERKKMALPPLAIPTDETENELSKKQAEPTDADDTAMDVSGATSAAAQGNREARADRIAATLVSLHSSSKQRAGVGTGATASVTGKGGSTSKAMASSAKPRSGAPARASSSAGPRGKAAAARVNDEEKANGDANVDGDAQSEAQPDIGNSPDGSHGQDRLSDSEQGTSEPARATTQVHADADADDASAATDEDAASDDADSDAESANSDGIEDDNNARGPINETNLSDADMP